MASEDVPTLRALIIGQRHLVHTLQQREQDEHRPSGTNQLASAIDKLATLERLAADLPDEGSK